MRIADRPGNAIAAAVLAAQDEARDTALEFEKMRAVFWSSRVLPPTELTTLERRLEAATR